MNSRKSLNRRHFIAGSAAAVATAACAADQSTAHSARFVIDVPPVVSMRISGSDDRFPVRRVYCLGRNYSAHAIESGDNPDETEMVVALKSGGNDIDSADALSHVFGYGVGLDMTRQDLQHVVQELSRPWTISKSFDKSAPCGPLHPVATNGHAVDGRIWLSVNGEVKQYSDLTLQRWSVPEGIAILSQYYELSAGDIILTGTPAGIGLVEKGDVINAGIKGLGEIEVRVT